MDKQTLWRSARAWSRTGWLAALWVLAAGGALAQGAADESDLLRTARHWVDTAVAGSRAVSPTPLRLEISVGALDSRLRLAACNRVEPYLPPGSRLWGRTRVGLRCLEGPVRWNVFLPVTVKAYGPAWVLRQDVASGTVLGEGAAVQAEVDWAEDASPVLASPQQWQGQVTMRALGTGQVLRQNVVRPAQLFQAGAQVRVVAQGSGFQITADGQALGAGVLGQVVKVRMDGGRIMSGVVLDANTVKLEI